VAATPWVSIHVMVYKKHPGRCPYNEDSGARIILQAIISNNWSSEDEEEVFQFSRSS